MRFFTALEVRHQFAPSQTEAVFLEQPNLPVFEIWLHGMNDLTSGTRASLRSNRYPVRSDRVMDLGHRLAAGYYRGLCELLMETSWGACRVRASRLRQHRQLEESLDSATKKTPELRQAATYLSLPRNVCYSMIFFPFPAGYAKEIGSGVVTSPSA